MKRIKGKYLTIILFCFCAVFIIINYSCNNIPDNIHSKFPVEEIDISIKKGTSYSGDLIQITEIIKLSEDKDLPIGSIDKITIANNRIFILDRTYAKHLFVYDRGGILLFKIGNTGNGPGEYYRSPQDFYINEKNKEIEVFEAESRKIVIYNWDGFFLKENIIKTSWPYSFGRIDTFTCFAYKTESIKEGNNHLLKIFNKHNSEIFNYKRFNKTRDFVKGNCFYYSDNKIFFVEDYCDTVCVIQKGKIVKGIKIDFGENAMPSGFVTNLKLKKIADKVLSCKYIYGFSNIVETQDYLTFSYTYKATKRQAIYNKKSGHYISGLQLFNDLFPSDIYSSYNENFITALPASYLEELYFLLKNDSKEWKKFLNKAHPIFRSALEKKDFRNQIILYKLRL